MHLCIEFLLTFLELMELVVALCWHGPLSVMEKAPVAHKFSS